METTPVLNNLPPAATPSKNKRFKISLIVLGILIVLGLFGNIYLLLKKQTQITPLTQIPSTSIPTQILATPTIDSTLNWKTYKNSIYKYSVKYPSQWYLYESTEKIAGAKNVAGFWPEKGEGEVSGIWVNVRDDRFSYTSLDSWWVGYKKMLLTPIDVYAVSEKQLLTENFEKWIGVTKTTISQLPALRVETKSGYLSRPYRSVFVVDKNMEVIEINTNITDKNNPNFSTFDQILSTFRFD